MTGIYRGPASSVAAETVNLEGDKGDITVSGAGEIWTIDNDVVTYAKMQNVSATDKLLGRSSLGSGDIEEVPCTAAGRALLDDASSTEQRTTLGLGSIATQNSSAVAITGGSVTGITDLLVTDGGTGASDAATARTNLGVAIGTNVLAYDANLQGFVNTFTLPTIDAAANTVLSTNGTGTLSFVAQGGVPDGDKGDITVATGGTVWTVDSGVINTTKLGGDITIAGKALLDDADATAQRTTLGLGVLATQGDGDKGDITVSGSGATWNIDASAVGTSKLADGALSADLAGRAKMADGYLLPAKLSTGGPTWDTGGRLTATAFTATTNTSILSKTNAAVDGNSWQNGNVEIQGVGSPPIIGMHYTGQVARTIHLDINNILHSRDNGTTLHRIFHGVAEGLAPVFACRAWVNFNGTGTVAIRASGNVSSVTDNGIGVYTPNLSAAMPDANYSVVVSRQRGDSNATVTIDSLLTTSVVIRTGIATTNALEDPPVVCLSIFR